MSSFYPLIPVIAMPSMKLRSVQQGAGNAEHELAHHKNANSRACLMQTGLGKWGEAANCRVTLPPAVKRQAWWLIV
jgi:hypothetical protein